MKLIVALLLSVVAVWAQKRPYPVPAEELEFGHNTYLDQHSDASKKGLLGAKLDNGHRSESHRTISSRQTRMRLPKGFVAGWDDWAECQNTIAYIKDQASCGSCWAVAASQVVAHRTCIACGESCEKSKEDVFLNENKPCMDMSGEQILSCCSWCGSGCQGGYPIDAMQYWARNGVVSGGWYGSKCGCQPYQVPPAHYGRSHGTPKCEQTCEAGYPTPLSQDKHFGTDARKVVGEQAMMEEIYQHGPIECTFQVYSNFMNYKNGIYNKKGGFFDGGHAITVIGWGELTDGRKYWVINNSWNTTWGADGRFFWQKGTNLLGMETGCVTGTPKCNNKNNALHCMG